MSCGVGCRHGLDHTLLWLWRRPAAVAPIQPLAWEPPNAVGATLKRQKKKKRERKREQTSEIIYSDRGLERGILLGKKNPRHGNR